MSFWRKWRKPKQNDAFWALQAKSTQLANRVHWLEDQLKSLKPGSPIDEQRLYDIEQKLESQDERFHKAYARTAENRLDKLEKQNDRYHEREKELLRRWDEQTKDLKKEIERLEKEKQVLLNCLNTPSIVDCEANAVCIDTTNHHGE